MKIKIKGTYKTDELVTLSQHIAAQLQDMDVDQFRISGIYLQTLDAAGRSVRLEQDGKVVDELTLTIAPEQFSRPVVTSGKIRAVLKEDCVSAKPAKRKYRRN